MSLRDARFSVKNRKSTLAEADLEDPLLSQSSRGNSGRDSGLGCSVVWCITITAVVVGLIICTILLWIGYRHLRLKTMDLMDKDMELMNATFGGTGRLVALEAKTMQLMDTDATILGDIVDLKAKDMSLMDTNQQLENSITAIQGDLVIIEGRLDAEEFKSIQLMAQIADLVSKDSTLMSQITALVNKDVTLMDKDADLQSQIDNITGLSSNVTMKLTDLMNGLMTTQTDIITLQGQVAALQAKNMLLMADIATIQGDVTSIQGDISTIQGDITSIQGDITSIQGDITTIQGDITSIQGDIATIQGDIATIQGDIATIQGDISTIQGDISAIQGDISTIQGDIVSIQGQVVNLEAKDMSLMAKDMMLDAEIGNLVAKDMLMMGQIAALENVTAIDFNSTSIDVKLMQLMVDAMTISDKADLTFDKACNNTLKATQNMADIMELQGNSLNGLRTGPPVLDTTTPHVSVPSVSNAVTLREGPGITLIPNSPISGQIQVVNSGILSLSDTANDPATPSSGQIQIKGAGSVSVVASGSMLTITGTDAVTGIIGDSGGPSTVMNPIVAGGQHITTSSSTPGVSVEVDMTTLVPALGASFAPTTCSGCADNLAPTMAGNYLTASGNTLNVDAAAVCSVCPTPAPVPFVKSTINAYYCRSTNGPATELALSGDQNFFMANVAITVVKAGSFVFVEVPAVTNQVTDGGSSLVFARNRDFPTGTEFQLCLGTLSAAELTRPSGDNVILDSTTESFNSLCDVADSTSSSPSIKTCTSLGLPAKISGTGGPVPFSVDGQTLGRFRDSGFLNHAKSTTNFYVDTLGRGHLLLEENSGAVGEGGQSLREFSFGYNF